MEKVIWSLPTSVDVNGTEYGIRSDYRAVLDILTALTDNELDDHLKAEAALEIFYPGFDEMPPGDYQEALNQCFRFIDRGQDRKEKKHEPALMSWEQDFDIIIAPINRIAGCEVRALEYLHWYSFLSFSRATSIPSPHPVPGHLRVSLLRQACAVSLGTSFAFM